MEKRSMNWGWLGAESLVIVGSILLAFWIEASWEKRLDSKEEHELLIGLEQQFETQLGSLKYRASLYDTLAMRSRLLLNASSIDDLYIFQIESGLGALLWAGTFDTGTGTLEALLSSGRLELIENVELRTQLSQWKAILEETQDNEIGMRDYVFTVFVPKLASFGIETKNLLNTYDIIPYLEKNNPDLQSYRLLLAYSELKSLAQYRFRWLNNSVGEFKRTAEDCNRILEAIRLELERN